MPARCSPSLASRRVEPAAFEGPAQRSQHNEDEAALCANIIEIIEPATGCGHCGYRRITEMLQLADCVVNHKRVERTRRRKGLKLP